jgi:hypothetical protein
MEACKWAQAIVPFQQGTRRDEMNAGDDEEQATTGIPAHLN